MESGKQLYVLRTDRGGKFTPMEFAANCTEKGVVRRQLRREGGGAPPTAPYSPQQNGIVERRHGPLDDEGEADAGRVSGRGGEHGGVHTQPLAHQGSRGVDIVQGLEQAQAECHVLAHVWVRRPRDERQAIPQQAGGQEHSHGVPRLREWKQSSTSSWTASMEDRSSSSSSRLAGSSLTSSPSSSGTSGSWS